MVLAVTACAGNGNKPPAGDTVTTDATESALGFDLAAMDCQPDTDAQPSFNKYPWVTRAENGYYYWVAANYDGFIMYYDPASGQKVPLCNRPECRHDSEDCNAYFPDFVQWDVSSGRYSHRYIQYYQGSIYIIGCDDKDYACLYRIAADGSSRECDTKLFRADFSPSDGSDPAENQEWIDPYVTIHRGYAYYVDQREKTPVLRRVKLGGSGPEELYTTKGGELPSIYRLEAYGDYLFFQTHDSMKDSSLPDEGLYVYDIKAGKVRMVKQDVIAPYLVTGGILYYYYNGEIRSGSLARGKEKLLVKEAPCKDFFTDGHGFYFFDDETGKLYIYDEQGEFINSFTDKYLHTGYYGCDSQYMFAGGIAQEKGKPVIVENNSGENPPLSFWLSQDKELLGVMDLSELKKGTGKWKYLYNFDYLKTE